MSGDGYLQIVAGTYGPGSINVVDNPSDYTGGQDYTGAGYLKPTHGEKCCAPPPPTPSVVGPNQRQAPNYQPLRPGAYAGESDPSYSDSNTSTVSTSVSWPYLRTESLGSQFDIPKREELNLPRPPRDEHHENFTRLPELTKEDEERFKRMPSYKKKQCTRTKIIISWILVIVLLGALGGAAYGIYYAVTKKGTLVVVYGEMNYTGTKPLEPSGTDDFRNTMNSILRKDKLLSPYYKEGFDIKYELTQILKFYLNFQFDNNNKQSYQGLFGALQALLSNSFKPNFNLNCLSIIPEQFNKDINKFDCSFNQTDFSQV